MKRALSEAFARYGMSVSVLHGGETAETKAFLQLVKRENGEESFSVTALGAVDEQCWRYLGPADVAVAMGGGAYYLACPRVVGVRLHGKLSYGVAACSPARRSAPAVPDGRYRCRA